MGKQTTATGLTTPRKKARKAKLNALEAAQLMDCMKAGMTPPRLHQRHGKGTEGAPLFEAAAAEQQTKLF